MNLFCCLYRYVLAPVLEKCQTATSCVCSPIYAVEFYLPKLLTRNLYQPPKSCQMAFYRSLSLNRAYPAERGSSLGRFHWSAVTAGWSRTPSVASVALCRASPTWVAHRSKSGRFVRIFFTWQISPLMFICACLFPLWNFTTVLTFLICFQGVLADYVPDTSPMIPPLVVHCISEIEQRGLHEVSGDFLP